MPRQHLNPVARAAMHSTLVALLAFALHVPTSSALAADEAKSKWQGRTVVLLPHAQPRIGSRLVEPKTLYSSELRVERVQGEFLWLGNAWVQTSEVVPTNKRGVDYFTAYLHRHPCSAAGYRCRAAARYNTKADRGAALADATRAIQLAPRDVLNYRVRTQLYREAKDWTRALADIEQALKLDPTYAQGYVGLALVSWESRHDYQFALAALEQAIQLDPSCHYAWVIRSKVNIDSSNWEQAITDAERALAIDSFCIDALMIRACAMGSGPDRDLKKAVASAERAVELAPRNGQAHRICGQTHLRSKNYVAALFELNLAIELDPTDAHAFVLRGNVYGKQQEYDAAFRDANEAIRLDPKHHEAWFLRARTHAEQNDFSAALSDVSEACRLKVDYAAAIELRGTLEVDLGEYEAAILTLTRALELSPNDSKLLYARGCAYERVGWTFQAYADYSQSLQFDPDNAAAYHDRGGMRMRSGAHFSAIDDYDKAIRLDRDNVGSYYGRAIAKLLLRDDSAALVDAQEALRLDPENLKYLRLVGGLQLLVGDNDRALEACDEILRIAPNDQGFRGIRAMVAFGQGLWFRTLSDCQIIRMNKPGHPLACILTAYICCASSHASMRDGKMAIEVLDCMPDTGEQLDRRLRATFAAAAYAEAGLCELAACAQMKQLNLIDPDAGPDVYRANAEKLLLYCLGRTYRMPYDPAFAKIMVDGFREAARELIGPNAPELEPVASGPTRPTIASD